MKLLALLLVAAACSPAAEPQLAEVDGGPPPPSGPIQWVEDGAYDLTWTPAPPAAFAACDQLSILVEGELAVEFTGPACALSFDVAWRGNCVCTLEWCLCPNVASLYAEIDGAELRAIRAD
jgi:hypothetical protein